MLQTTLDATKALFRTDPTVTPTDRARLLAIIRSDGAEPKPSAPPAELRIVRRSEVAHRLGRSLRSVDLLAKAGILRKHKFPGRTRAAGFLSTEIDRLLTEEVAHV